MTQAVRAGHRPGPDGPLGEADSNVMIEAYGIATRALKGIVDYETAMPLAPAVACNVLLKLKPRCDQALLDEVLRGIYRTTEWCGMRAPLAAADVVIDGY